MSESLLRLPAVKVRTGLSRSTIYELARLGKFPKPIKLYDSAGMSAWIASEIDEWISAQVRAARPERSSERAAVPV
jgi:prophage regulatory protein